MERGKRRLFSKASDSSMIATSLQKERCLVTGAAGFIGSHLVERLARLNIGEVIALDNLHRGKISDLADCRDRIRFCHVDVRDQKALRSAMLEVDVVFHLAAESNVMDAERDPNYTLLTNVIGTVNVLRSAHDAGVRRVIFCSSREVYGEPEALPVPETAPVRPKNCYGASKAAAEAYCRTFQQSGLEVIVLRLANVFGPRDHDRVIPVFLRNCQLGNALVIYGGSQVLDFIWIDDVVESLLRAATAPYVTEPINIGSGLGISVLQLAKMIRDLMSSRSELEILPPRSLETSRFVADTRHMQSHLGITIDCGFVNHLTDLLRFSVVQEQGALFPSR